MTENNSLLVVTGSTDDEETFVSVGLCEDEEEEDELGDEDFERLLNKRSRYGLTKQNKLWTWSMRVLQCVLCLVVIALVAVVVYQTFPPGGSPEEIRKSDGLTHDPSLTHEKQSRDLRDHHVNPHHPQQLNKKQALARALKNKREHDTTSQKAQLRDKINDRLEGNMDPRLKAQLSQWQNGELSDEEKTGGRTLNGLLDMRKQPPPGEIPHHLFSTTPTDIADRTNPLRSEGRSRYGRKPLASPLVGSRGARADARLGHDPRVDAYKKRVRELKSRSNQLRAKKNDYRTSAVHIPSTLGRNLRPTKSGVHGQNGIQSKLGRNLRPTKLGAPEQNVKSLVPEGHHPHTSKLKRPTPTHPTTHG